ncbi:MAG: hydantoinase B/oxoprolinase family protein, partial [Myxococcota bacterium]
MTPASDPIELEIFKHLFASIAEEMGVRLMRSAYSPNIKERRDHSCILFDAQAETIAQAAHIPVHLGSAPMSVRAALEAFPPQSLSSNDIIVLNDPFAGGTHLPDITLVAPCIIDGEQSPRFFVANRAHHADVGGTTAGSMPVSQ